VHCTLVEPINISLTIVGENMCTHSNRQITTHIVACHTLCRIDVDVDRWHNVAIDCLRESRIYGLNLEPSIKSPQNALNYRR
jgi:hypothetical protein